MILFVLCLAVLGLVWGSFVNALVWRLHEQEELSSKKASKAVQERLQQLSIMHGRSMCTSCGHELVVKDLVPVLSWLWLRGRCRYCGKPIPDTPVAELVTMLLFIVSYIWWPLDLHGQGLVYFCFWLVFIVGFVALAIYDFRWYILPDRIVFPLIALAVVQLSVTFLFFDGSWQVLLASIESVVVASGIFFVLYMISDGTWIGGGDVKLGIVLGLLLGSPLRSLLLLFLASLLGTLASVPILLKSNSRKRLVIPFGPFLLLAAGILQLFGDRLVNVLYRFAG